MKRINSKWGLFSVPPIHDKTYVWFITKQKDSWLNIPMWTTKHRKEIKGISFDECIKLAAEHEEFLEGCEWF